MTIYFVRHASAGQKKLNPKKDEKRPLDADGIRQCTQMGRLLAGMETTVEAVISSPLKRATQTAALVANEIGYEGKLNIEAALHPRAKYTDFREMLRKYSKADSLMLVGHNPNFSAFLGQLVAENGSRSYVDMKKGAVAKVETEQKKFVIQWLITPRVATAAAESSIIPPAVQAMKSQNGSGELEIPAEYSRSGKKHKKLIQTAFTTNSRPKTSRK
ncbi:MAG: phosphohistidine phosphatase SixA [Acidobacteria bacterium]|nr:phosphohistidine phosphatase SixA [Acidobacteriota bacterium]MBV9145451.1 phosphohistidine phosphatase SixA [Acidobacteriota bacterium]MBV9438168.1 phosphohistidine phosphatase SixA [Acidobacteriota bacterium]